MPATAGPFSAKRAGRTAFLGMAGLGVFHEGTGEFHIRNNALWCH
jgi:hypothetical protein